MEKLTEALLRKILKKRRTDSHKGEHGHALLIAGSPGKMGAAVIAARACLRSGVGLLSVGIPVDERLILQTAIPEAMLVFREQGRMALNSFSAIAAGPGLGTDKRAKQELKKVLENYASPLLLDADALNIISASKTLFNRIPEDAVLTPHPREFDRLFGEHKSRIERISTALQYSLKYKLVIVLKGSPTVIAYRGRAVTNASGNSGLAKAGSGDALTGIITAFLAQGYPAFDAARLGVYLHGKAADLALRDQSVESMIISDVIEQLGHAFKALQKKRQ